MNKSLLKFLIRTLLFSLLIAGVGFILSKMLPADVIRPHFYFILIYFFALTIVFYFGLSSSLKGRPQQFVRYFMGATTMKLLVHVGVVVIFSLLNKAGAVNFILSFFSVYILFTAYEVRFALKLNKATVN
jgi:hypothetical protein